MEERKISEGLKLEEHQRKDGFTSKSRGENGEQNSY